MAKRTNTTSPTDSGNQPSNAKPSDDWSQVSVDVLQLSTDTRLALKTNGIKTAGDILLHEDLSALGITESEEAMIQTALESIVRQFDSLPPIAALADKPKADSLVAANQPTTEQLIERTDQEIQAEFLNSVREAAIRETDDNLCRMLTKAKMENHYEIQQIVNQEIDQRFMAKRKTQQSLEIDLQFSDLLPRGYSASQESVSRFLHRQRLSHEAGVALARVLLAMKEGGVKLRSGTRVTTKSNVVEKVFELAYEKMKSKDGQA